MSPNEIAAGLMDENHPSTERCLAPLQAFAADASPAAIEHMLDIATAKPVSGLFLFVSAELDFDAVVSIARNYAPNAPIAACTTAGEISDLGYSEHGIVAIGFPADLFDIKTCLVQNIETLDRNVLITQIIRERALLQLRNPTMPHEFGFILVDGLSMGEEKLTSALAPALGTLDLFGGSAGDGERFERTRVWFDGQDLDGGGAIFLVRSRCRSQVFRLDNFTASDARMVVTDADARQRLVRRINDEPAAQEYARILGYDTCDLRLRTFAAHPVAVRIGASHHIRAIRDVTDDGHLVFASAVSEGMVLNLAEERPAVAHLERHLAALSSPEAPALILGFECLFRRMASAQNGCTDDISDLLQRNKLIGFSTYGEQYNSLHVNQTLVGVALYPAT